MNIFKGTGLAALAVVAVFSVDSFSVAKDKADNSKHNKVIEETKQLNAQDQSEAPADIKLTQDIRQAVVKDDSFSMEAKNVKIISVSGIVTLKGPVKNLAEKNKIEVMAVKIAGKKNVHNEITVTQ